jgi:hypothetical protein
MFSQNSFTFNASALTLHGFQIICSNVMQISNLQNPWNIISLPFNQTVSKSKLVVNYQGTEYTWQEAVSNSIVLDFIYSWNRSAPQHYELVNTLIPGYGYWVFAYNSCTLSAKDVSTFQNDGFFTDLKYTWNIIGAPNDVPIVKQDIIVKYSGVDYSWADATTNNNPTGGPIILEYVYNWSRDSPQHYELSDVFDPGYGYQIYAYYDCSLYYPIVGSLDIPSDNNPNIMIGQPIQDESSHKVQTNSDDLEWETLLEFNEPVGTYDNVIFGERTILDSTFNVPKSPSSLSPYLRAWFDSGSPDPFDELWEEYKLSSDSNLWNLLVQWVPLDQGSNTVITISWDRDSFKNSQYESIVLIDASSNEIVSDMLREDSYSFECSALELQNFNILCSSNNNQPPRIPSIPSPSDGTINAGIESTLSWLGGDPNAGDTISYDIYFGKDHNPTLVKSNQLSTEFDPGTLEYDTVYYWRIVAWDNNGASTSSSIWEFKTKESESKNQIVTQEPVSKTSSIKLIYMSQKILNNNENVYGVR